jgi:hypothetical protein
MTDRGDELHDDGHGELVDERDGTAWERTPWRAVQTAGRDALIRMI